MMTTGKHMKTILNSLVWLICILSIVVLPLYSISTAAATPKLESIRVALFIDTGKYRLTTPAITLASDQGFTIGMRTPAGVKAWLDNDAMRTMKGSLDQYKVQLLETNDYVQAKVLYQRLADSSFTPYLYRWNQKGLTMFQVGVGPYVSMDAAVSTKDLLSKNAAFAPLFNSLAVTGPLRWSTGSYATEAEAIAAQRIINQVGLKADLAYQENAAGTLNYAVWVGNEPDPERLNAVRQLALTAMPGITLQSVDTSLPYLVKVEDVSVGNSAVDVIQHYLINPLGEKVWITPKQGEIAIKEKANHTYRGNIELSQLNGKLAVINELPFEQYVYGVVSSEMGKGWPTEALKAQAVASRTFALQAGLKYQIAHVSDSTIDQAYNGIEYDDAIRAVDATKGEVLVDKDGSLITPYYSANAGGITADPSEIWGNPVAYLKSVPSPDEAAAADKAVWRHVVLADGTVGYVSAEYLKITNERNAGGLSYFVSKESGVNVRPAPNMDNLKNTPISKLNVNDRVISFDDPVESNSFSWQRGPFDALKLADLLNNTLPTPLSGSLQSLEVSKKGPSGRVTELKANGQVVKVSNPDRYRSILGGLPSTLFEIEETGRYTILGANGAVNTSSTPNAPLYVLQGQAAGKASPVASKQLFVLNGDQQARVLSNDLQFIIKGKGFGHGVGMSQWGARGYANQGFDYQKILQTYYTGVSIAKE